MREKVTIIYHSADYDGIFCREIAKRAFSDRLQDVTTIGWNYGDARISIPETGLIYILDLNPECLQYETTEDIPWSRLVWIDHHASAIEDWGKIKPMITGYRINGVAACRLAWQWFHGRWNLHVPPTLEDFTSRAVKEPLSVRLAGEYDVWDKRDPNAEAFQYGLVLYDELDWNLMFDPAYDTYSLGVAHAGHLAMKYVKNLNAGLCKSLTWIAEFEGLRFLCVNHVKFNSTFFEAKDVPETGHDALLGFRFDGEQYLVSLYHAKHRTDIDLSEIAKRYGGGGHKGACGFRVKELPAAFRKAGVL